MSVRQEMRQQLCNLAEETFEEGRVRIDDGNGGWLTVTVRGGDIGVQCFDGTRVSDVTFSGSGGHAPLTREALRMLSLAMATESGHVRAAK